MRPVRLVGGVPHAHPGCYTCCTTHVIPPCQSRLLCCIKSIKPTAYRKPPIMPGQSTSRLEARAAGVMQVLPHLLDVCPEARLNLAVHYLRQGQLQEAFKLVKDLQPATPQEYTLKGQQRMLLICIARDP